jgi:hypothetical protein
MGQSLSRDGDPVIGDTDHRCRGASGTEFCWLHWPASVAERCLGAGGSPRRDSTALTTSLEWRRTRRACCRRYYSDESVTTS